MESDILNYFRLKIAVWLFGVEDFLERNSLNRERNLYFAKNYCDGENWKGIQKISN